MSAKDKSKATTDQPPAVLIEVLEAGAGKLGLLQLNAEKTLNSLTLDMVKAMSAQLSQWQGDDEIKAVILKASGDKAFCAGGDVQQLYQSAIEQPGGPCEYAEEFFLREYQLDFQIHSFTKPIICIGHGIVMGGGLGLMAGASHRIATETTRIAMPEITIGLYPDVGGTWFLNRMPRGLGQFFALTGASINANDALYTQLADYVIPNKNIDALIEALKSRQWQDECAQNHALVDEVTADFTIAGKALDQNVPSEIKAHLQHLEPACQSTSLGELITAFREIDVESKWFNKAISTLKAGSPLSALIIYEQLRRYKYADLRTVFLNEYLLSTNVVRYPEFSEGVRALLIDKDKKPKWQFQHFSEVPASLMDTFFSAPWDENPLEKLI